MRKTLLSKQNSFEVAVRIVLKISILMLAGLFHSVLFAANEAEISGQILLPNGIQPPAAGFDVVLLKFVLTEQGEVSTQGPQARVKSNGEGKFRFLKVPKEFHAAYRIGTRVNGELYHSDLLFLNNEESIYIIDIVVPDITQNLEALQLEQVSLILEADIGRVRITEVWEFLNSTRNVVDSRKTPLTLNLPEGYRDFSMIDTSGSRKPGYRLEQNELRINRLFPRGSTRLIFQYALASRFGYVKIEKKFRYSLEKVKVFTPINQLQLSSAQLSYVGEQKLHEAVLSRWKGKVQDSGKLDVSVSSVPVQPLDYGLVALVLMLALTASVLTFYLFRLKRT